MHWIYLSPHSDDVALSCGGLVWEQVQAGQAVSIWTVCAGDPPAGPLSPFAESLHARWQTGGNAMQQRRLEDSASCQRLGAAYRPYDVPDCIYRVGHNPDAYLYTSEEALFGALHPDEAGLVRELAARIMRDLPDAAQVVCPLGLGNHVDHQFTRAAAQVIGRPLWYYADYPYVLQSRSVLDAFQAAGWQSQAFLVSETGLQAWGEAVAAHTSQISTFWPDLQTMRAAIRAYAQAQDLDHAVIRLWRSML